MKGFKEYSNGKMTGNMLNLVNCMSLCNESKLLYNAEDEKYTPSGLPTEAALKVLVEKLGQYD